MQDEAGCPSGQWERAVNPSVKASEGSNPSPATRDRPPCEETRTGAFLRQNEAMDGATRGYEEALAEGRRLYPGIRIGRPGRARSYWVTIALMRVLRVRWKVTVTGQEHLAPGAGILIGNHISALDPVVAVMSTWMRVTAFTKVEVFAKRGAVFFRLMGQIPLRRGDEPSTVWAMDMATRCLAGGGKLGLYPEGTRSPDPAKLHRLHRRILIPVLQAHPGVPVYAIGTSYARRRWRRTQVKVNISRALDLRIDEATQEEVTDSVRDALLVASGQQYVHVFARDVKESARP